MALWNDIASDTTSSIQSVYGLWQMIDAEKNKPDRPVYKMPGEANAILDLSKSRNSIGMPGEDTMRGDIGAATANAFTEARKQGRFDVGSLYENELNAMRQLGATSANYKLETEKNLSDALFMMSQFKDKEFAYNEAGKYSTEYGEYLAKKNQGYESFNAGLEGIGSSSSGGGMDMSSMFSF